MADVFLTQEEADAFMRMEKHRVDETRYDFPDVGRSVTVPLVSEDKRERFLLDVASGRIDLARMKYQNRARQVVVLVRLDLAGAPHRNPDDEEIPCPHIHVYREGYGDKYAEPAPRDRFSDLSDRFVVLQDFMRYCRITQPPLFEKGLLT